MVACWDALSRDVGRAGAAWGAALQMLASALVPLSRGGKMKRRRGTFTSSY